MSKITTQFKNVRHSGDSILISNELSMLSPEYDSVQEDAVAKAVAHGMVEGLNFLVLTLLDAVKSKDEQDRALFLALTADKSEVMEKVRHQLLSKGGELSAKGHESLFSASSLYERIVWLMRQYCLLLNGLER